MKLNWNFLRLAMLAMLALSTAGCGGINAGTTISPATFLLPGILKADPPQSNDPIASAQISQTFASSK